MISPPTYPQMPAANYGADHGDEHIIHILARQAAFYCYTIIQGQVK